MVLRNGYFSYRWTDIFDQTGIPSETIVLKGQPVDNSPQPQFMPHDIDAVIDRIKTEKPAVPCSRPTWKPPPASSFPTSTSVASRKPCTRTAGSSSSTASRAARRGWT